MKLCFLRLLVCSTCLATTLLAQASVAAMKPAPKVDARNSYNRVIAVVPIVGKGTVADPKRPKYVPWPPAKGQSPTDIIGYSHGTHSCFKPSSWQSYGRLRWTPMLKIRSK